MRLRIPSNRNFANTKAEIITQEMWNEKPPTARFFSSPFPTKVCNDYEKPSLENCEWCDSEFLGYRGFCSHRCSQAWWNELSRIDHLKSTVMQLLRRNWCVDAKGAITHKIRRHKKQTLHFVNRDGYRVARCGSANKYLTGLPIHVLQAYQIFGDRIFEKRTRIVHTDGNKLNDAASNLQLVKIKP